MGQGGKHVWGEGVAMEMPVIKLRRLIIIAGVKQNNPNKWIFWKKGVLGQDLQSRKRENETSN